MIIDTFSMIDKKFLPDLQISESKEFLVQSRELGKY